MRTEYRIFDAAHGELTTGVTLVEASAGTGKTYAITMLVLRAVVELQVPIDRILIVTFTKAATEELRQRIRDRLVMARNLFAGKGSELVSTDATFSSWADTLQDKQIALSLLQLALADIDRAGVFTIHGFCQRMMVEQALESGQLFDIELLADIEHIRQEIAEDFWRSRIYSLAPLPCGLVVKAFATPDLMLASVKEAKRENCRIEPRGGNVEELLVRLESSKSQLTLWWREKAEKLASLFRKSLDAGHFKKEFSEAFEFWWQELDDFFSTPVTALPDKMDFLSCRKLVSELNGQKIRGDEKKLAYFTAWPLPTQEVDELLAAADALLLTLRVELAGRLRTEVMSRLERLGNSSFDDLIIRLSRALQGDRGAALRVLLGERYKVALIDEFQDTDGLQWHIFSSIFGGGKHALYLIGDPKQAIYKFRGADIHSYFLARHSAGQLLTLEKNYRSHPYLVKEVNRLFLSRPKPFFYDPDTLGYRAVLAGKSEREGDLQKDGQSLAGMVYCMLGENQEGADRRWFSGEAAERLQKFSVAEIGRLLDPEMVVTLQSDAERPLAPKDIAILVRSHRQGESYRKALVDAGIPATVSSRESVFHSNECRHLHVLLQAIATPGDVGSLRTALTIPWFGCTGNDLWDLQNDEDRLNQLHSRFFDYHQVWREQGVLAMMNRLLVDEEVLITLAAGPFAERIIANIFHLLELVQEEESSENRGMSQIVQWLLKVITEDRDDEHTELLLESDEEAVRIVTMHGAKGLEYPVVFCPFLWYRSNRSGKKEYQVSSYEKDGTLVVDLGSEHFSERWEQAVKEQMAEELRLLYVAITRAKIRCYVMWADVKSRQTVADSFQSALGYLLFPEGSLSCLEQATKMQSLAIHSPVQVMTVTGDDSPATSTARVESKPLRPLMPSGRSLSTDWQMTSYSAMAMLSEYQQEAESVPRPEGRLVPVPGLPLGAGFGNVIHDLLEEMSFSTIASGAKDNTSSILEKCMRYGVSADPLAIATLLQQMVKTPLLPSTDNHSFCLSAVDDYRCLKEMSFYFQLGVLATERINAILSEEATVVPLSNKTMRGYLTGFIDLVCEFGGRYYVLDYKTNYLGDVLTDYHKDNLLTAMQSHNYGLQYWIYTLVLHRHLQNRISGYDYQRHFGGVIYLFVRGMTPDIPGSGVFATLPDYDKLMALDLALRGDDDE